MDAWLFLHGMFPKFLPSKSIKDENHDGMEALETQSEAEDGKQVH